MNTETGSALVKFIERRIAAEAAPLRKRITELENEVRTMRASESRRPGVLKRLAEALTGGSHD